MKTDEVLEEIWRIKDERAKCFHYNVREMGEALMKAQKEGNRPLVNPPSCPHNENRWTG